MVNIAVPKEINPEESRVAATPDSVKRLIGLGCKVVIEKGAGAASRFSDDEYEAAGALLADTAKEAMANADIILKVRRPAMNELSAMKPDVVVIATMDPHGHEKDLATMAKANLVTIAMEFMPRITRAQSMDILSSQANLAGYQAVIDAAQEYDRAFPMMMTAAGTVPAAKCFVMGAGVAGLQAIATARRLGAQVSATDVRPASKEQVESLGAKFIAVEDDEFKNAETAGGYAKEMSDSYKGKQAALIAQHITKQDIVITTALIPGKEAPRLVSKDMLVTMRQGSVLVDLAVERGGNVEGSKAGAVTEIHHVKVVGHLNVAGRIAATASQLYAKNLFAFVETLIDKENEKLAIDWDDELVRATLLTRDGHVVHPTFAERGE